MTDQGLPDDSLKALEREVGDLLAEADALSSELSSELGDGGARRTLPADDLEPGQAPDACEIDRQLTETEAALAATAREVGSEEPQAPPAPKKQHKLSLPPKGAAPAAKPPTAKDAGKTEGQPPVEHRAGSTVVLPGRRVPGKTAESADRLVAGKVADAPLKLPPALPFRERLRALVPVAGVRRGRDLAVRGVAVCLEWLDRPFQRIGYGVRVVLGWCSLAMLTAAAALYFFAVR